MIRQALVNLVLVWCFCAASSALAQCSGGCSDASCACCDCNGNCLLDSSNGCCGVTPIVVDVRGTGFKLSGAEDGVMFDFFGTGKKLRLSWPARGSENAWLVLDRNHNGVIDDGTEMFGNITPQPKSATPNGFLALAVYDLPENGGNGDGIIDAKDSIYSSLRLWIDKNHNGVSEPDELFTLPELNVVSINLSYALSQLVDEFGNVFRYKSTIADGTRDELVYDVFLVKGQPPQTSSDAKASGH